MELRHLRYFVAVANAHSFRVAAEKLHFAQSALSRQIKELEEELGVELIVRTKPRVSLTREGTSFLADAKRMLTQGEKIIKSVQELSRKGPRVLNVGYTPSLFFARLPNSLAGFHRAIPTIAINLFDLSYGEQLRALSAGAIDLGFIGWRGPVSKPSLKFQPLVSYRMSLACSKNSSLAKKSEVQLQELKRRVFIGMSERSYPGYRRWLGDICARADFIPKVVQDEAVEPAQILAVAAGLGVALLPEQMEPIPNDDVVLRELRPVVMCESCIAWNRHNHSEALKVLIEHVIKEAEKQPHLRLLIAS